MLNGLSVDRGGDHETGIPTQEGRLPGLETKRRREHERDASISPSPLVPSQRRLIQPIVGIHLQSEMNQLVGQ